MPYDCDDKPRIVEIWNREHTYEVTIDGLRADEISKRGHPDFPPLEEMIFKYAARADEIRFKGFK